MIQLMKPNATNASFAEQYLIDELEQFWPPPSAAMSEAEAERKKTNSKKRKIPCCLSQKHTSQYGLEIQT